MNKPTISATDEENKEVKKKLENTRKRDDMLRRAYIEKVHCKLTSKGIANKFVVDYNKCVTRYIVLSDDDNLKLIYTKYTLFDEIPEQRELNIKFSGISFKLNTSNIIER